MKHYFFYALVVTLFFNFTIEAKPRLIDYYFNNYSQHGEDGIIKKIFEIIGTQSKVAVEFGAWDGFYLSNTANLWVNDLQWKAVLIESDKERFKTLTENTKQYNCLPIRAKVGIEPEHNLEFILEKNGISFDIDLLSIDIDGNDYHIFRSLDRLRPRVIICEHNPTIPVTLDIYAGYSDDNNFGCSVPALVRVAESKGYKLIALTATNAFFVSEEDFQKFTDFETSLPLLDTNEYYIYIVSTYDGRFAVVNKKNTSIYGIKSQYSGKLYGSFTRCCQSGLPALEQ